MAIKGLDRFMGEPIEGTYEKALSQKENLKSPAQTQNPAPNLNGFIYVPSINLYVAKERTLQGKNWNDTHSELKKQNLFMPTIYQFREFLKYLKENPASEHISIYNDITEVRTPWRSEWLDAYFEQRQDGLYGLTQNKTKAEKLDDCLMQDKIPGIVLDDWVNGKNVNRYGIPNSNTNLDSKGLYYWHPRDGAVARFNAYSDWALLSCNVNPSNSYSALGVFACAEGANDAKNGGKS